jgi:hypothetical protein
LRDAVKEVTSDVRKMTRGGNGLLSLFPIKLYAREAKLISKATLDLFVRHTIA